ncbi:hypothetical protein ACFOSV_00215 [Algoriphagus namhaensis]|uniref:Uncharacterized protein n=1 Tax=Algoriphagus namhaensis TaxID=915353 RepID=A0ABV8ALR6_9BACT
MKIRKKTTAGEFDLDIVLNCQKYLKGSRKSKQERNDREALKFKSYMNFIAPSLLLFSLLVKNPLAFLFLCKGIYSKQAY